MDDPVTLARSDGVRGEVVVRRRGDGDDAVDELIVNGAFAMDSSETSSERELARLAYQHGPVNGRMLIAGLGLGHTAAAALRLPVGRIDVVEIEPCLLSWSVEGITPLLRRLAREPRVNLVVGDIADVLTDAAPEPAASWDAIVLDVDNGPDFLIHADNAVLYSPALLLRAYARLTPGGRLAIWCQGESPALLASLNELSGTARQHLFAVQRGARRFSYAICTLDRPLTKDASVRPE